MKSTSFRDPMRMARPQLAFIRVATANGFATLLLGMLLSYLPIKAHGRQNVLGVTAFNRRRRWLAFGVQCERKDPWLGTENR